MKKISEISRIYCKLLVSGIYNYGFTVTYENGEFKNYIYQSDSRNDEKIINKLQTIRQEIIKNKKL